MADRLVRLSAEHVTLPRAELVALLAVHDPDAMVTDLGETLLRITPSDGGNTDEAIRRMALAHSAMVVWGHGDIVDAGHAVKCSTDGQGSVAVRAHRFDDSVAMKSGELERELGQGLADTGHPIDLTKPKRIVRAWTHDGTIWVGEHRATMNRSQFEQRQPDDREHFSPVSMHPRRAAGLIHLARVKPGGRVLDPFCGTGGIVLEAAMQGHDTWGSDIDEWMVQGTLQALADVGPQPLKGNIFRADIGDVPDAVDAVDGIVTDLPYGRASSTDYEAIQTLYRRAFLSFADLLPPGGRVVFGCADLELGRTISGAGFDIAEEHAEYVHRSLTRHYLVAVRRG